MVCFPAAVQQIGLFACLFVWQMIGCEKGWTFFDFLAVNECEKWDQSFSLQIDEVNSFTRSR